MTGAEMIAAERRRQVEAEGWTHKHDDEHSHAEMAYAAAAYANPTRALDYVSVNVPQGGIKSVPDDWPWDPKWWKPTPDDRIRELVKAGALIAAEIDRLQRCA